MEALKHVNKIPGFRFELEDKFMDAKGEKHKIKGFIKNKKTKEYAVEYKNLKTKKMTIVSCKEFENFLINDRFRYLTKEEE